VGEGGEGSGRRRWGRVEDEDAYKYKYMKMESAVIDFIT
jgi:hypothetical protein